MKFTRRRGIAKGYLVVGVILVVIGVFFTSDAVVALYSVNTASGNGTAVTITTTTSSGQVTTITQTGATGTVTQYVTSSVSFTYTTTVVSGTTQTAPSWVTTTYTTTSTIYQSLKYTLTIDTVSASGGVIQGQISVDGTPCAVGSCSVTLQSYTTHSISYGQVAGFATPAVQTVYVDQPETINGVYTPSSMPTTTLSATFTNYGQPVPDRAITATAAGVTQTIYTDSNGVASFTVSQNTAYSVCLTTLNACKVVQVGASPASVAFAETINGPFSLLGILTNGLFTPVWELVIGILAFLVSIPFFVKSADSD